MDSIAQQASCYHANIDPRMLSLYPPSRFFNARSDILSNEPERDNQDGMEVSSDEVSAPPSVSPQVELTNNIEAQRTAATEDDSIEKVFEHFILHGFKPAVEQFLLYGAESTVASRIDEDGERLLVFTRGSQTTTIPAAGIASQEIVKKSRKAYKTRKTKVSETGGPKPPTKAKSARVPANNLRFQEDMTKGPNAVRAAVQPNGYCESSLLLAPGQACKEL